VSGPDKHKTRASRELHSDLTGFQPANNPSFINEQSGEFHRYRIFDYWSYHIPGDGISFELILPFRETWGTEINGSGNKSRTCKNTLDRNTAHILK